MTIRRVALATLLYSAAFASADAQGTRLFAYDLRHVQRLMPSAFTIQGIDLQGERSLVVWGGYGIATNGDTAGVLYGQLLTDSTPVGLPFVITSPASRPSGYVDVVAVRDRFVVIWKDRRDPARPRLYARNVSAAGEMFEAERPLVDRIPTGAIERYGDPTAGRVLRWRADSAGVQRHLFLTLDADGSTVGAPRLIDAVLDGQLHRDIPSWRTIVTFTDGRALTIDETRSRIEDGVIPSGRLQGSYHLHGDGSISTIEGSELVRYPSLVATTPAARIVLERFDSVVGGIAAIVPDGEGWAVTFARLVDWETTAYSPFEFYFLRNRYDALGGLLATDTVSRSIYWEGYQSAKMRDDYRVTESRIRHGCGNGTVISHTIFREEWHVTFGHSDVHYSTLCRLVATDIDSSACTLDPTLNPCMATPAPPLVVTRQRSDSISAVIVTGDSFVRILSAGNGINPGYDTVLQTHRRTVPSLGMIGDTALLTFMDGAMPMLAAEVGGSRFDTAVPYHFNPAGTIPHAGYQEIFGELDHTNIERRSLQLMSTRDGSHPDLITDDWWQRDSYLNRAHMSRKTVDITERRFALALPSGWKMIANDSLRPRRACVGCPGWSELRSITASDPNSGLIMMQVSPMRDGFPNESYWQRATGFIDAAGDVVSTLVEWKPSGAWETVVPGDGRTYLGIRSDSLFRVDQSSASYVATLQPSRARSQALRLLGNRFVRTTPLDSGVIALDLFELSGVSLAHASVIVSDTGSLRYLEDRADSSLNLLWSDSLGIHAARFGRGLDRVVTDTLLVAGSTIEHFTAVVSGDSLRFVWEDLRGGYPDLYTLTIPALPAATSQSADTQDIPGETLDPDGLISLPLLSADGDIVALSVVPNPAHSVITVALRLEEAWPVSISVVDERGRVVSFREEEPGMVGENRFTLDVGELMPGAYTVVLEAGIGRGEGKLVIAR